LGRRRYEYDRRPGTRVWEGRHEGVISYRLPLTLHHRSPPLRVIGGQYVSFGVKNSQGREVIAEGGAVGQGSRWGNVRGMESQIGNGCRASLQLFLYCCPSGAGSPFVPLADHLPHRSLVKG